MVGDHEGVLRSTDSRRTGAAAAVAALSLADGLATALVASGPDAPALLARWRSAGWRGRIVPAAGDPIDPGGLVRPLDQDSGGSHRG